MADKAENYKNELDKKLQEDNEEDTEVIQETEEIYHVPIQSMELDDKEQYKEVVDDVELVEPTNTELKESIEDIKDTLEVLEEKLQQNQVVKDDKPTLIQPQIVAEELQSKELKEEHDKQSTMTTEVEREIKQEVKKEQIIERKNKIIPINYDDLNTSILAKLNSNTFI
ncbi:hypothetical protein [Abyssisolibacter fermentans]|uniref:hypothetical protein n=1 Tax=Abyssisolibacter fermentans TaxID=1766203 RepID=UPI00083719F2|nr:hypothetical protein [Abyssisolibacter fermentans]